VETGWHADPELRELADMARQVARERYAPRAETWDTTREPFPHDERRYLGSLGLLGICLPERFGGSGAPLLHALVVIEELAKECRPAAFQVFEANTGPAQLDVAVSFSEDVIIEGIRRIPESEQFVDLLGDLKAVPRLTRDPMSSRAFRMLKDAVDVLDHVDGKTSFEELLKHASSNSGSAAAKILYSLMFTGLIEAIPEDEKAEEITKAPVQGPADDTFGDQTLPVSRRASRDAKTRIPEGPPSSAEMADPNRRLVLDTYRQLDWLSHYDLLGISRRATQAEIEKAYEKRSVLFDPSYKEHPELRDLFRQLSVLARWLKVAYDVLSNSVSRTSYDKKIAESPSLPEGPPPKE